jgi:hypothetical protein
MNIKSVLVAVAFAAASFGGANAALVGSTISAGYYFPNDTTPYPFATASPDSFAVGAGVETVINVEDVTDINVDFGDDYLTILFNTILTSPTWNVTEFNGVIFEGMALSSISGVSVDAMATTMAGFDIGRVTIVGDRLLLNWNGLSYVNGTTIRLDFEMAEIPLPVGWTLMLAGLALGSGASALRRRLAAA